MTDTVESAVTVNVVGEEKIEAAAPPGHYYTTVKDRRILIKDINEAQSMVLGGYMRQINGKVDWDKVMGIFGKLMLLLENLIVDPKDMEWLEEQIMLDNIGVADFAAVFHSHRTESVPVPVKKPRRGK